MEKRYYSPDEVDYSIVTETSSKQRIAVFVLDKKVNTQYVLNHIRDFKVNLTEIEFSKDDLEHLSLSNEDKSIHGYIIDVSGKVISLETTLKFTMETLYRQTQFRRGLQSVDKSSTHIIIVCGNYVYTMNPKCDTIIEYKSKSHNKITLLPIYARKFIRYLKDNFPLDFEFCISNNKI